MSSQNSGGRTAEDEIEQYLKQNSGWHEVADIANATSYTKGHIRSTSKRMTSTYTSMEGRKNSQKKVIGYEINGDLVVPGGDRGVLLSLIRTHATNPPANLSSMSVKRLQKYLRNNIATSVVPLESKLEFRWT
jgi:hypothetical protein